MIVYNLHQSDTNKRISIINIYTFFKNENLDR